ncbi:MAG: biotin transporter BioY [Clostridia bacterium]|nr:biotin transporter BioY [Clostridia bacterium]
MRNQRVRNLTHIALLVAFLAAISQISIPTAFSVPFTLQIFAVCLICYIFSTKKSLIVLAIYISLGAIGIPVFANFQGGIFHLVSYTGGFIWGYFFLVILCSLKIKKMQIFFGIIGVIICHLLGTIQYSLVAKIPFFTSFLVMSLPYLLKDFILVILAYFCAKAINSRIKIK